MGVSGKRKAAKALAAAVAEDHHDSSDEQDSDVEAYERSQALAAVAAGEVDAPERVNDQAALQSVLGRMRWTKPDGTPVHWLVTQAITSSEPVQVPDVNDDLTRELAFYNQALAAAKEARVKLEALGVPHRRPDDYFAEMVKSDEHMTRVRRKLVSERESIEAAEERRRQRELRKLGKQVQVERIKEKAAEKKANLNAIKKWRKTAGDKDDADDGFGISVSRDDDDDAKVAGRKRGRDEPASLGQAKRQRVSSHVTRSKRQARDTKYGMGGQKRHLKKNTSDSAKDMSGFSKKRNNALPGQRPGKTARGAKGSARPGKNKRMSMRSKR